MPLNSRTTFLVSAAAFALLLQRNGTAAELIGATTLSCYLSSSLRCPLGTYQLRRAAAVANEDQQVTPWRGDQAET